MPTKGFVELPLRVQRYVPSIIYAPQRMLRAAPVVPVAVAPRDPVAEYETAFETMMIMFLTKLAITHGAAEWRGKRFQDVVDDVWNQTRDKSPDAATRLDAAARNVTNAQSIEARNRVGEQHFGERKMNDVMKYEIDRILNESANLGGGDPILTSLNETMSAANAILSNAQTRDVTVPDDLIVADRSKYVASAEKFVADFKTLDNKHYLWVETNKTSLELLDRASPTILKSAEVNDLFMSGKTYLDSILAKYQRLPLYTDKLEPQLNALQKEIDDAKEITPDAKQTYIAKFNAMILNLHIDTDVENYVGRIKTHIKQVLEEKSRTVDPQTKAVTEMTQLYNETRAWYDAKSKAFFERPSLTTREENKPLITEIMTYTNDNRKKFLEQLYNFTDQFGQSARALHPELNDYVLGFSNMIKDDKFTRWSFEEFTDETIRQNQRSHSEIWRIARDTMYKSLPKKQLDEVKDLKQKDFIALSKDARERLIQITTERLADIKTRVAAIKRHIQEKLAKTLTDEQSKLLDVKIKDVESLLEWMQTGNATALEAEKKK